MDEMPRLLCAVGVQAGEFAPERIDKGVLDVLVEEQVVRGDAGLAAVEAFAPGDAAGGEGEVRILVHDAGTLAAEFQHHRRQVLGLGGHRDLPERRAAGQEHQVVTVPEQFPVHGAVALDHGDVLLREGIGDEVFQRFGDRGHVGRGFQDGRAARGDGPHEGIQQQLHRIVPRRNDERAPEGLPNDITRRRKHHHRRLLPFPAGPSANVPDGVPDFSVHQADLGHVGLLVTLVQVGPEGVTEGFLPFPETGLEGFQLPFPPCDFARGAARIERALLPYQFPDALRHRVFHFHGCFSPSLK